MKVRAPLLALVAGVIIAMALLATAVAPARPAAAEPDDAGRLAEQVRVHRDGDLLWTMRVTFDSNFTGDTAAVAGAIAAGRGFGGDGTELASSFVTLRAWRPEALPVVVRYNPSSDPLQTDPATGGLTPVSADGSILRGISAWNTVAGQSFRFQYGGTTAASTSACDERIDGVNMARFTSTLPPGVLGLTCTLSRSLRGDIWPVEFDMEISNKPSWSVASPTPSSAYDLDTTVLHELGHALGLDHTDDAGAVMFDTAMRGESKRVLTPDDIAGMRALYGVAAPPTASPPPPPAGSPSVTANGSYNAGANSVVVLGPASAASIATMIAAQSGRTVLALWALVEGQWLYYLPAAPGVNGGFRQVPGAVGSIFAILS